MEKKVTPLIAKVGIALVCIGAILTLFAFKSIIYTEIKYTVDTPSINDITVQLNNDDSTKSEGNIRFLSPKFGIAIPRIDANANVIANVSPYKYGEYNSALEKGVAHADGTALPGEKGNVFMFAHSAVNFYESGKYNVYFYLLPKLKKDDKIYVSYENKIYTYSVEEVKVVKRSDVKYLAAYKNYNTLTLMTCWPAGIDLNRVIVTARELDN